MDDDILAAKLATYDESVHDLIKELLEEYFKGDAENVGPAAIGLRRQRLERERDAMKAQRQKLNEGIQDIEDEIQILDGVVNDLDDEVIEHALEAASRLGDEQRIPSNLSIRENAAEVGFSPEEFIERLNEEYPTDRFGNHIHDNDDEESD